MRILNNIGPTIPYISTLGLIGYNLLAHGNDASVYRNEVKALERLHLDTNETSFKAVPEHTTGYLTSPITYYTVNTAFTAASLGVMYVYGAPLTLGLAFKTLITDVSFVAPVVLAVTGSIATTVSKYLDQTSTQSTTTYDKQANSECSGLNNQPSHIKAIENIQSHGNPTLTYMLAEWLITSATVVSAINMGIGGNTWFPTLPSEGTSLASLGTQISSGNLRSPDARAGANWVLKANGLDNTWLIAGSMAVAAVHAVQSFFQYEALNMQHEYTQKVATNIVVKGINKCVPYITTKGVGNTLGSMEPKVFLENNWGCNTTTADVRETISMIIGDQCDRLTPDIE